MTGIIATIPQFQFNGANGLALSGGTLTTYLAGTTTLETTYQDQALTIANTNPIVLDAAGGCTIWLSDAKTYKFVLKNSAGVTQWTQDNINGTTSLSQLTASSGSSLVGYLPAGTGAVATTVQAKLRENVSVLDFYANGVSGAPVDPTGVIDSTLGIQAAITAARNVHIPVGTYKISSTITIPSNTCVWGDGIGITILSMNAATTAITLTTSAGYISIRDIQITRTGAGQSLTSGVCGIDGQTVHDIELTNVRVDYCDKGIALRNGSYLAVINNCTAYSCTTGFFCNQNDLSNGQSGTTFSLHHCYALACGIGYSMGGISDCALVQCVCDVGASGIITTNTSGLYIQYCTATIVSCHVEGSISSASAFYAIDIYNSLVIVDGGALQLSQNPSVSTSALFRTWSGSYSIPTTLSAKGISVTAPTNYLANYLAPRTDSATNVDVTLEECYLASTTGVNASLGISGNVNIRTTLNGTTLFRTVSAGPTITDGVVLTKDLVTAPKFKTASSTNQTLTAATAIPMFNVPSGFTLLYVWINSSGANYQSIYALKSDGVTAVATAISAGANLTVTIVGSSPPVANITCPSSGTCNWSYETISL